jgi:hypothetical protein
MRNVPHTELLLSIAGSFRPLLGKLYTINRICVAIPTQTVAETLTLKPALPPGGQFQPALPTGCTDSIIMALATLSTNKRTGGLSPAFPRRRGSRRSGYSGSFIRAGVPSAEDLDPDRDFS